MCVVRGSVVSVRDWANDNSDEWRCNERRHSGCEPVSDASWQLDSPASQLLASFHQPDTAAAADMTIASCLALGSHLNHIGVGDGEGGICPHPTQKSLKNIFGQLWCKIRAFILNFRT